MRTVPPGLISRRDVETLVSDDGDDGAASAGEDDPREHLRDISDDCGCAEVWDHLSEAREAASEGADTEGDAPSDAAPSDADAAPSDADGATEE